MLTPDDGAWVLDELWAPIVAVTAAHEGQAGGLIASTALNASLLPEAPRVSLLLSQANRTHDLALASQRFALHLLPDDERGLELFHELGIRSGEDKLEPFATHAGTTGAPILDDAVAFVEAHVVNTFDCGEFTFVLADAVAGHRVREADVLTIEHVRERLPRAWAEAWQRRFETEVREARRRR
jgi:flavin reductase (DIM6/NTAB) family NADH-FMN oxidoreductase RutF